MAYRTATLAFLFGLVTAAHGLEWRLRAGSDIIGEQFYLIERDTLDVSTELRGQLQTLWDHDGRRWRGVRVDHRLGGGTHSLRDDVSGEGTFVIDSTWQAEGRLLGAARHYLATASGARSDFVEGRASVLLRHGRPGVGQSWGIDQGVEGLSYRQHSPLLLNAARHWHGIVFDGQHAFDLYGARAAVEHEIVPDSSGLGFWGLAADAYGMRGLSAAWDASGDLSLVLRRYRDRAAHPHEADLDGRLRAGWRFAPTWSFEASTGATAVRYSPADSIYYDVLRLQPAVELVWWPTWGSIRLGPTVAWQRSASLRGEDYVQWGAQAGTSVLSGRLGFVDLAAQVGRRNYVYPDEAVFTDYTYWDLTLVVAARLPGGVQLDTFLIGRTEGHRERGENTRSILLTVDVSRALRR